MFWRAALLLMALALARGIAHAQNSASGASQVRLHLERAQAAMQAHHPRAAETELRAVLALDPNNAAALVNLGVIAFFQGDCAEASANFRKAIAVGPVPPQAQALLGICESQSGGREAEPLLRSAFEQLKDPPMRAQVGLVLAGLYYRRGELDRAAALAETLVKMEPDNVDILYMAHRIYSDLADETLNKLVVVAPKSAQMQQTIAESLIKQGDLKGAIQHYRKALQINPNLSAIHFELGEALVQSWSSDTPEMRKEAETEFDLAMKLGGDRAEGEYELGRIAFRRQDLDQAEAAFRQALTLDPGNTNAELGLGRILTIRHKPHQAEKYLKAAIQADPFNRQAHYQLGVAYRAMGNMTAAKKEFDTAQEIRRTMDEVKHLYQQMQRPPQILAPPAAKPTDSSKRLH